MQMDKYLNEVTAYISNIGNTAPAHRSAFKQGFSFSGLSFEEQLAIWNEIWKNTTIFWVRVHAFFFLEKYIGKKYLHEKIWKVAVTWQGQVNDWGINDCLSKIYTKILETHPDTVYDQLAKWNKSKDLWKRRQSVVSLLYYTRTKKTVLPFERITALITPLLPDKEYYVQKGVGWAMRELYNAYPRETLPYFKKHIHYISPIAFTAAMEKIDLVEKEKLKSQRKTNRLNSSKS